MSEEVKKGQRDLPIDLPEDTPEIKVETLDDPNSPEFFYDENFLPHIVNNDGKVKFLEMTEELEDGEVVFQAYITHEDDACTCEYCTNQMYFMGGVYTPFLQ